MKWQKDEDEGGKRRGIRVIWEETRGKDINQTKERGREEETTHPTDVFHR